MDFKISRADLIEAIQADQDAANRQDVAKVTERLKMTREQQRADNRNRSAARTPGPSLTDISNLAD